MLYALNAINARPGEQVDAEQEFELEEPKLLSFSFKLKVLFKDERQMAPWSKMENLLIHWVTHWWNILWTFLDYKFSTAYIDEAWLSGQTFSLELLSVLNCEPKLHLRQDLP